MKVAKITLNLSILLFTINFVFLAKSSSINDLDINGYSKLHIESIFCQFGGVITLINQGADINLKTRFEGNTALHLATYNNCETTVKILLKRGADVFVTNHENLTPLQVAKKYNLDRIIKLIEPYLKF
ncbi:MAG: ankyrin repeat domain-containing protein [Bdellovibrionales bacterium]|nr:ankyrin repeat domain-containing protein [Bdellovibrionales bacterium]